MRDRYLGKMNRVADDIAVALEYLRRATVRHGARGGAGDRLLMYAQLKEWAEKTLISNSGIQKVTCLSSTAIVKG
ncbi:hypothetical protein OIU92_21285 [Escherichia coli]|nr:hypothetical protein [Escherichia coli]